MPLPSPPAGKSGVDSRALGLVTATFGAVTVSITLIDVRPVERSDSRLRSTGRAREYLRR
jgi:hypothetical protein